MICNAGLYSFVGGGFQNRATGCISTISGGICNTANGCCSIIGGGNTNVASGILSTIGGGEGNIASGARSGVFAGGVNTASGNRALVFGGSTAIASGSYSAIVMGVSSTASGDFSFIGGGGAHTASGKYSTISGGYKNTAQAIDGFIGGGAYNYVCNVTSGCLAFGAVVVGGVGNNTTGGTFSLATGFFTIAPTICNAGQYSFVGGGFQNKSTGNSSTISGGYKNTAGGACSFIGGGICNTVTGSNGMILGGSGNTVSGLYSAAIGCGLNATEACTLYANNFCSSSGTISATGTKGSIITSGSSVNALTTFCGSGTVGGASYIDFIRVTNNSGGATNPNKTFRVNGTGGLEVVNSTYGTIILSLTDAGVLSTPGGGTSDLRRKINVQYINDEITPHILNLKPVKFEYKDYSGTTRHGFIAQDVLETYPELVLGDGEKENGTYGLDYDGILSLTVKSLQETILKVENLEKKLNELKNKLG